MEVDGGIFSSCVKAAPESPRTPARESGAGGEQNNSASVTLETPSTPTSPPPLASGGISSSNGGGSFAHLPPFHLQELMTLVSRIVAYSFESHTGSSQTDRMKQMPQTCSTLTHLLYLQHKYPVPSPPPPHAHTHAPLPGPVPLPQARPTRTNH